MVEKSEPTTKVFAVPRRFGISTVLLATTIVAIISATLRAFHAPTGLVVVVLLQLSLVVILQFIFTRVPRLGSVLGGLILAVGIVIWENLANARYPGTIDTWLCPLSAAMIVGPFFGYVTGVLVGAVFLVLDKVPRLIRYLQNWR